MTDVRRSGQVVLGLSADYHDAAACVLVDGVVVAAAEEERFSRVKHDPAMPVLATKWCLEHAGVGAKGLDGVAFYSKPLTTYERILATHAKAGPAGLPALSRALRTWTASKLWVGYRIEVMLLRLGYRPPRLVYSEHHHSHAASAFYPSPFERAAVLTFDGVGEWTTSSIARGSGRRLEMLREQRFPDSLGLFYSAMTAQCGFAVNDGEYKLMGLAPFGEPRFVEALEEHVISVNEDGSVRLNQRAFGFRAGRRMGSSALDRVVGAALPLGAEVGQREADLARSTQVVIEKAVLAVAHHAHALTGEPKACLAGGVALNCVANRRLLDDGPFDEIWVQPAAGDSGGALGAAMWQWHEVMERPRAIAAPDGMAGAALGPAYTTIEVADWLRGAGVAFEVLPEDGSLHRRVARALADGQLVGWFRGRMEFGPRALGHRSILADPRDPAVVGHINSRVKRREGFRPFAPAVLAEHADDWFDVTHPAPYMTVTAPVAASHLTGEEPTTVANDLGRPFADRLAESRSEIPACTHVDGSARLQTVDAVRASDFHRLLKAFHELTGCPVLLNTSFNGPGEPIVCTPADALRTFERSGLDLLVLEGCLIRAGAASCGPIDRAAGLEVPV